MERNIMTLVLDMARTLNGVQTAKLSAKESLDLVPQLETLLKSVMNVTDVQIVMDVPIHEIE